MPELYDQHTHSHHSFDSETPPAANVEAALAAGLGGVIFTEHFDTHPDEWEMCRYDDARYSAEIAEVREAYLDRAYVGKGIEICYQPGRWDFILDFLSQHSFDLVILSVHWTARGPIHERAWWRQFASLDDAAQDYFQTVREAVAAADRARNDAGRRIFDVLGHLDLVKRYATLMWDEAAAPCEPTLLDEILEACLAADLTPEVNTSLVRQGGGEPMPGLEVMARYRELGGDCMSIGSDAHLAEHVGADFAPARRFLKEAGFAATAQFQGRVKRKISLD